MIELLTLSALNETKAGSIKLGDKMKEWCHWSPAVQQRRSRWELYTLYFEECLRDREDAQMTSFPFIVHSRTLWFRTVPGAAAESFYWTWNSRSYFKKTGCCCRSSLSRQSAESLRLDINRSISLKQGSMMHFNNFFFFWQIFIQCDCEQSSWGFLLVFPVQRIRDELILDLNQ